jgi:hypothetical protein
MVDDASFADNFIQALWDGGRQTQDWCGLSYRLHWIAHAAVYRPTSMTRQHLVMC